MVMSNAGGEPFGQSWAPSAAAAAVVSALAGHASITRGTPRPLRRGRISLATSDWLLVQPLSAIDGAAIAAEPPLVDGVLCAPVEPVSVLRCTSLGSARDRSVSVFSQSKREPARPLTVATRGRQGALKSAKLCSEASLACTCLTSAETRT